MAADGDDAATLPTYPEKPEFEMPGAEPSSVGAKAVYDDVDGDTRAAFERFKNENPSSSDDSSDYDEYDDDQPRDIYGDGAVIKQLSVKGEGWDAPKDLCKCTVSFTVFKGAGESMETISPESECQLRIDEKESPYGFFDDVLKTMRKGETSDVTVLAGVEEGLPEDAASTVRVTLVDFERAPVGHEMENDEEKLAHVASLKANGNGWFKKGDLQRAKRRYDAAVTFGEYEQAAVKDALPAVYGNLAAVATSLQDWPDVVAKCDKVLENDPSNVKAHYRKGAALGKMKEFEEAITSLKNAAALDPSNKPARKALRDVAAARKAAKDAEKKSYGDMFTKLAGFASQNRPKDEKAPNELDDDWDDYDDPKPPGATQAIIHKSGLKRAFFDITIGGASAGRVVFELFDDTVPKTANNFLSLCVGDNAKKLTYKNCGFHRVIKGFMVQGGDFTKGDGTGGESIYGGKFDDEAFVDKHDRPGLLSMANAGADTNGSQFFITTVATPHLDDKHVVFGRVVEGMDVVTKLEETPVDDASKPASPCVVSDCGELPCVYEPDDPRAAENAPADAAKTVAVEEPAGG